jgi:hypothetical protein
MNGQTCHHIDPLHCTSHNLLYSLLIADRALEYMSIDCVMGLLLSSEYNAFHIIVDDPTIMPHYILYFILVTTKDLIDIFLNNIIKLYSFLQTIISDQDLQSFNRY